MAGVLDALASYVASMLTEMAKEEVAMLIGVSDGIKDLSIKLGDLKNFLADADKRNITEESVRGWVGELKRAMYLATDIVDLCQLKAMEQGPSKDMGCLNPLLYCMRNPLHSHDIGTRIKALNKEMDSICKRSTKFKFAKLEAYQDLNMTRSLATNRKTDSLMERIDWWKKRARLKLQQNKEGLRPGNVVVLGLGRHSIVPLAGMVPSKLGIGEWDQWKVKVLASRLLW
ncbi:hypothetical protein TRIUR3_06480 [Triticum urartu]|uniref:Disease resistance N-terminal domain-containing protein n=1 Tax=Triticum urartu TaxID=4572 RepID=M8AI64_TRIUA|nr:hypothetical protein TRIUR3_06480 [Triticum urartu]